MSNVVWGFPNEQAILDNEAQSSVELLGYKSYVFSVSQIPGDLVNNITFEIRYYL